MGARAGTAAPHPVFLLFHAPAMWLFMYACYLLSALSFALFFLLGVQGYFRFPALTMNHATLATAFILIYLLAETMIMFFFVGTGISVRDYTREHNLGPERHRQTLAIKRRLYPPTLLNVLLVMTVYIIGGGVHTRVIPAWVHGLLFWVALWHMGRTLVIQHRCFRDNTFLILDMAGAASPRA
jgi:hypothetical protein